ncbi:MAG: N-acetylmuramoyl-L-alanine amidase [Crocinitomicaceae bacterium]|nr:N-acetylmuramoyl-L-alanine amidase [Crocinitomicaceae bacterium]
MLKTLLMWCIILWVALLGLQGQIMAQDLMHTVVIDAGHGGKDPGCIGKYLKEKDVALRISLKLGEFIKEKYPDMNVVYTRDKDVFLALDERAKIANKNNADLFISIHANAASPKAYGTETFVLGLHRTESQQKVAERENSIIHFEENSEEKYADFDLSPDAIIARQIQLSVFLDQSIYFASNIQKEFGGVGRFDRGVKQAGFLVLYKTTMPSVLVEAGFLTNPAEENFLRDTLNQDQLANAIFRAFQQYKNTIEGNQVPIVDASYIKNVKAGKPVVASPKVESVAEKSVQLKDSDIIFKIQIDTSRDKLSLTDPRFKGEDVSEYVQDGLFKYTVDAIVNDFEAAKKRREELVQKGFQHAFVVAFRQDERMNISEAIAQSRKNN